jgi:hypothetical protein
MRLLRFHSPRVWRRTRRTLVAAAGIGLVAVLLGHLAPGLALFGSSLIGLVLLESSRLQDAVQESRRQNYAHLQIRALMGDVPLDLSGWAADPLMVHNAVRVIVDVRPALVLECGSGSSTLIMARCLHAIGRGRIVSLDHEAEYARGTTDLLGRNGLAEVASVVTAPLVERTVNGQTFHWYSQQYEALLHAPIDVLIVDGPPGSSGSWARYPAVPLLRSRLAAECRILLDDGNRPDERAIARLWAGELGATLTYLEGGRGGWLLQCRGSAPPAAQRF